MYVPHYAGYIPEDRLEESSTRLPVFLVPRPFLPSLFLHVVVDGLGRDFRQVRD